MARWSIAPLVLSLWVCACLFQSAVGLKYKPTILGALEKTHIHMRKANRNQNQATMLIRAALSAKQVGSVVFFAGEWTSPLDAP